MNQMTSCRTALHTRLIMNLLGGSLLFILCLPVLASTMTWSPQFMSFFDIPYNTTATRTLTLTNEGGGLLQITNIEWEYMTYYFPPGEESPAAFDFSNVSLPVDVPSGESMDIEISFSPVDDGIISIANAQLLITNNSDNAPSLRYWLDGLGIAGIPTGPVDLSGTIKTADGSDICAMALASGQYMFSCNPSGVLSLPGLPREPDGTVKRQIYADGFFPRIDTLTGSSNDAVIMTRSGTCPSYNPSYDPAFVPNSAGKRINIAGTVLLQDSQTAVCAMVLANGKHMFSCDGTGSYALDITLDNNGRFKLQVYADGFAPTIQTFDESRAMNDVGMARAAECQ